MDTQTSSPRSKFSRVGFAFAAACCIALLFGLLNVWLGSFQGTEGTIGLLLRKNWFRWAMSFLPVYALALPAAVLIMKNMPADPGEQKKISPKGFFIAFLMCFPMMLGGNILGTMLASLLTGGRSVNNVTEMISQRDPLVVLTAVIAAPLFEELVCRKCIIDRLARFGEKTAVLVSALVFSLFHGNLYQIFYAFGIGLIFGYVYLRTRKIGYTMLMHFMINFLSGVVAAGLMSFLDPDFAQILLSGDSEALTVLIQQDPEAFATLMAGAIPLYLYSFLNMGLAIGGLVLLCMKKKEFFFLPAPEETEKGQVLKTAFLNAGMILFAVLSVIEMVIVLIRTCR